MRERLAKMTDQALIGFGRGARYMCSPEANVGKPPRPNFVLPLEEAIAEWKRRNPQSG